MHKSSRKYFEGRMAGYTSDALDLFRLAVPVLERDHGIPASHFQHGADIVVDVIRAVPSIVTDVHLLVAMGEDNAATQRVRSALATLKDVDPCAFDPAPSPRLLALLSVGGSCAADSWASAVSSADYATSDERRRRALKIRRELYEAGEPIPDEADAAPRLGRDEARADEALTGGGLRASRAS